MKAYMQNYCERSYAAMEKSLNFNLGLPEGKDKIDVSVLSSNFRVIDKLLKELVAGNPFIRGVSVNAEVKRLNYISGAEMFADLMTLYSYLPVEEDGNYYKGMFGCDISLRLGTSIELDGPNIKPFYVYPMGKDGVLEDCEYKQIPIFMKYNVISKQVFFEADGNCEYDDSHIVSEGNTICVPVGMMKIAVTDNYLNIDATETKLFKKEIVGDIALPGLISEEEEEN
jgi:hypothetical protein